jgi:hypothetical protein
LAIKSLNTILHLIETIGHGVPVSIERDEGGMFIADVRRSLDAPQKVGPEKTLLQTSRTP